MTLVLNLPVARCGVLVLVDKNMRRTKESGVVRSCDFWPGGLLVAQQLLLLLSEPCSTVWNLEDPSYQVTPDVFPSRVSAWLAKARTPGSKGFRWQVESVQRADSTV